MGGGGGGAGNWEPQQWSSKKEALQQLSLQNQHTSKPKYCVRTLQPGTFFCFFNTLCPGAQILFSSSEPEATSSRVSPIFKKGKRDDPNNYRPISVIPTVAKIFEKCVCDQLSEYLNANNLLSHRQSRFRSLHSTLTALVDSANSWSVNISHLKHARF